MQDETQDRIQEINVLTVMIEEEQKKTEKDLFHQKLSQANQALRLDHHQNHIGIF